MQSTEVQSTSTSVDGGEGEREVLRDSGVSGVRTVWSTDEKMDQSMTHDVRRQRGPKKWSQRRRPIQVASKATDQILNYVTRRVTRDLVLKCLFNNPGRHQTYTRERGGGLFKYTTLN